MNQELTELAKRLSERTIKSYEFDIKDCVSYHSNVAGKFKIKVLRTSALNTAQIEAVQYIKEKYKDISLASPETIETVKMSFILEKACFVSKLRSDGTVYEVAAFPSGRWILDQVSPLEIGALFNLYASCVRKDGPIDLDLSEERLEHLANQLARNSNNDSPNVYLGLLDDNIVAEIAIRFAVKIDKMNNRILELEEELEQLKNGKNQD